MSATADLHTHSTASDGQYTPSELVQVSAAQCADTRLCPGSGQRPPEWSAHTPPGADHIGCGVDVVRRGLSQSK